MSEEEEEDNKKDKDGKENRVGFKSSEGLDNESDQKKSRNLMRKYRGRDNEG